MKYDAIVVGGGLFGQIISKALRIEGRVVLTIDREDLERGSRPAACLMKPSWFSALGKEIYEPSLDLLDRLYGVHDIQFSLRPLKVGGKVGTATVHWVPPHAILSSYTHSGEVTAVHPGRVHLDDVVHEAPLVVVAAGVWTERLLPKYRQTAQKGVAFLWDGGTIDQPFIHPWAPYRQLVAFDRGDGLWVSDGTAIKESNWTDEREQKALDRCMDNLGRQFVEPTDFKSLLGLRPYAKGHKPCLLEEVKPGLWVASGGAKNGTLAAGWCAHEIVRRTS